MTEEVRSLIREELQRSVSEVLAIRKATVVVEATAYVGIGRDTLYEECRKKKFPHFLLRGRLVSRLSAIDEWFLSKNALISVRDKISII